MWILLFCGRDIVKLFIVVLLWIFGLLIVLFVFVIMCCGIFVLWYMNRLIVELEILVVLLL